MNSSSRRPIIEIADVSKQFGATRALDRLHVDVYAGELFGLVGPDGAGKTTLFRILVSLLEPDAGAVRVLDLDPVRDLWALRRRVGYMPGRFALYTDLSVRENLEFFAAVFGTSIDEGYGLIAPIYGQIERFASRRAGALSGGMKQKLALCCALVHRPDLLFLDEPTTGVDAVSRREFWDLLSNLRDSGLTTIVSTPYMDEAMRCDRVALMQTGRILAVDAPAALGAHFPRPLFAISTSDRRHIIQTLRGLPEIATAFPFGDTIHVSSVRPAESDIAFAERLRTQLTRAGYADAEVRPIGAGIEDVFIELMGATAAESAA